MSFVCRPSCRALGHKTDKILVSNEHSQIGSEKKIHVYFLVQSISTAFYRLVQPGCLEIGLSVTKFSAHSVRGYQNEQTFSW